MISNRPAMLSYTIIVTVINQEVTGNQDIEKPVTNKISIRDCNHKRIGKYYKLITIMNVLTSTIISILIKLELDNANYWILSNDNLNIYLLNITLHGILMIFFVIVPILLSSYGNYLIPIYLGCTEVIYPRVNNISVNIILMAYILIIMAMISEHSSNGLGWTLYPPLSTSAITLLNKGIEHIIDSLMITNITTSTTSINTIISQHIWKTTIITYTYTDIYLKSLVLIGYLLMIVLPILVASLLMILSDIHINTIFFDPLYGGDPILFQHIFWFFAHPEVYILMIPSFGLLSNILSEHINVILFGYQSMILAMSCISYIGTLVWSHHMYTINMEVDSTTYFMTSTLLIALPTSTKIFNWLSTYLNTYLIILRHTKQIIIYTKMLLIMLTIGGSTGLILGNTFIDLSLHDTYYVVSHFHIVLSIGTLMTILIGYIHKQQYLLILVTSITNILSQYHFIALILGISVTFIPIHFLSFNTLPRRISDFPDSVN
jgi:cytochrome c oxidase subunit 1